jgi:1-phosphofructokinase family hexose kinase
MILTVTPNPALDRVIFIDEFQPGTSMRAAKMGDSVGGKGLGASVALRTFELDTLALGFVAGPSGQLLVNLLDGYGIRHHLIWLEGDTRIAHVLVETQHHRHSHVIAGELTVPPQAATDLLQRYQAYLPHAAWVIAAGSLAPGLPPTYYHTLTKMAHAAHVPILIDGRGPPIVAALPAQPTILKMNRAEFAQTFGGSPQTLANLQEQGEMVRKQEKLTALVLTCGEEGILALSPIGSYRAISPIQPAVNAAGAGDTASAMLAWRFSLGDSWPEALRWTAAASAASVLTEGTGESRRSDVERILAETRVESLNF